MHALLLPMVFISIGDFGFGIGNKILILACLGWLVVDKENDRLVSNYLGYLLVGAAAIFFGLIGHFASGWANFRINAFLTDSMFYLIVGMAGLTGLAGKAKDRRTDDANREAFYRALSRVAKVSFAVFIAMTVFRTVVQGEPVFAIEDGVRRFSGTLGAPATAIYLLALMLIFVDDLLTHRSKGMLLAVLGVQVLIILTNTRMASLVSLGLLTYLAVRGDVPYKKPFLLSVIAAAVFGAFAIFQRSLNSNGRDALWEYALQGIWQRPIFGNGAGSATELLGSMNDAAAQFHNDYLKILFISGAVGLALFSFVAVYALYKLKVSPVEEEHRHRRSISMAFIIAFLAMMVTDNIFVYHFYIYPMVLYAIPQVYMNEEFAVK